MQAIDYAATGFDRSIQGGEGASAGVLLWIWSVATDGRLPFSALRACFEIDATDHFTSVKVGIGEGVWHLAAGRTEDAVSVLGRVCQSVRKNLLLNPYSPSAFGWLSTALRRSAEAADSPAERRTRNRRAYSIARWSVRFSRMFACERPVALRKWGLATYACGKPKKGLHRLQRSLDIASQQEATWEHALSTLAHARRSVAQPGAVGSEGLGSRGPDSPRAIRGRTADGDAGRPLAKPRGKK